MKSYSYLTYEIEIPWSWNFLALCSLVMDFPTSDSLLLHLCAHDLLLLKGLFIFVTFYLVVNKFMRINQCPTCSLLFYWVSNSGWDMVTCLQLCGLWDVQLHTLHWNVLYKLIQTLLLLEKRFVINLIMSSSV
jgi:hypothetical protein